VSDSQQLALSRAVIELEDSGGHISSKKLLLTKLAITRSSQFPLPPTLSASVPMGLSLAKKVLSPCQIIRPSSSTQFCSRGKGLRASR